MWTAANFPPGYNLEVMFHCKVIAAGFVIMMKAFGSNPEPSVRLAPLQSPEVVF